MESTDRNRTIALAALFQSASLVNQLAYHGNADKTAAETLINSLFVNESGSIDDIYGGLDKLRPGFKILVQLLNNPGLEPKTREVTRYAIGLLHLQRELGKHADIGQQLLGEIDEIGRQREFFGGSMNVAVIARIAEIYRETVSTLGPKIVVHGEKDHLDNGNIAAQVRALLLAGIRAAVLWEQAGGSRWKLFWHRKQMIQLAQQLGQVNNVIDFSER